MDRDKITAEWAKKTSKEILGAKVQKQLNEALDKIKTAVGRNENSTTISEFTDKLVLSELNKRGFSTEVTNGYNQRESGYVTIKW